MATWKKLVQFNSGDTITVSNPTANSHAATKAYVDNATTGIVWSRTNNVLEPEDTDDVVKILKGLHLSGWYTHNLSFGSAHSSHSATNTGAQIEVPLHATNGKAHGSFKFYTNSGDVRNLALTLEESGVATFGKRVDIKQSGDSILNVGSTGSGQADVVVDASNGDAAGGDYAFLSQYNDLSAAVGTASNAGNFLLKSKGSTAVTLNGTTATFAGAITAGAKISTGASLTGSWVGEFLNTHASGHGLKVRGGDTSSQYAFYVEDVNASWLFQVLGDGQVYHRGGNFHIWADNTKLRIGASEDLELWHDGSNNNILSKTGHFKLTNSHATGNTEFEISGSGSYYFDNGLPSSANREIARFSAASARPIALGWIDSGSKMSLYTPDDHSLVLGTGALGTNNLEINAAGNSKFSGNVGIGCDPSTGYPLMVQKADRYLISINNSNASNYWWLAMDDDGEFVLHCNGVGDRFTLLQNGQATFVNTTIVENSTEAIFRVKRSTRYGEVAQNSSGTVFTGIKADGNTGFQISSYGASLISPLGVGTSDASARTLILGGRPNNTAYVSLGFDSGNTYRGCWDYCASDGSLKWWSYDSSWASKFELYRTGNVIFKGNVEVPKLLKFTDANSSADFSVGKVTDGNDTYLNLKADSQSDIRVEGNLLVTGSIPNLGATTFTGDITISDGDPTITLKNTSSHTNNRWWTIQNGASGDGYGELAFHKNTSDGGGISSTQIFKIDKDGIMTLTATANYTRIFLANSGGTAGSVYAYGNTLGFLDQAGNWGYKITSTGSHLWNVSNAEKMLLTSGAELRVRGNILAKQGSYIGVRNTADSDYAYSFKMPYGSTEDLEINPSLHYRNTIVKHGEFIVRPPDNTSSLIHLDAGGTGNAVVLIDAGTTTRHPYISFAHGGTQYWYVKSDPDNSQGFAIQRDGFGSVININTTGAITYNSNQGSSIMWFKNQGTTNGAVYGSSTSFGLLDEGGNWFYKHNNDASHQWYTADTLRMTLSGSNLNVVGEIESGSTIVAGGAIRTDTSTNYALLTGYLGGLRVKSSRDNAAGIILHEKDGTHITTLYGETDGDYGFLDADWGNWDIKKRKGSSLEIDIGGTLKPVIYNGYASDISIADSSSSYNNFTIHRARFGGHDASLADILWNNYWDGSKWDGNSNSYKSTILRFDNAGMTYWVAPASSGSPAHVEVFKVTNDTSYNRVYLGSYMALDMQGTALYVGSTTGQNKNTTLQLRANDAPALAFDSSQNSTFYGDMLIQDPSSSTNITVDGNTASGNDGTIVLKGHTASNSRAYVYFNNGVSSGGLNWYLGALRGSNAWGLSCGNDDWGNWSDNVFAVDGNRKMGIGGDPSSGKLTVYGDLDANRFRDRDNVNYYLEPAATSALYAVNVFATLGMQNTDITGFRNIKPNDANNFIGPGTSDGSDNGRLNLGGGGSNSLDRGAWIELFGNEYGDSRAGQINMGASKGFKMSGVDNATYALTIGTTETANAFHIYNGGSGDNGYIGGIDQSSGNTNFAIHSDASHNSYVCRSGANFGVGSNTPLSRFQVNYDSGSDPFYATDAMIWGSNRTIASGQGNLAVGADNYAVDYGGTLAFVMQRYSDLKAAVCGATISGRKENSTNADYASYLAFATRANGGSLTEQMRIRSDGTTVFQKDVYVGGGNRGSLRAYGSHDMSLHSVHSISFDWNANYDAYMNHGIASSDHNGNNNDCISINSYNDINLRLDSNNNNDASYFRIHNNSTGDSPGMYTGYDGARWITSFDGKVGIATGADASYALKVNGHTYIANDCTVGGPLATNGQSASSLYGVKTKTTAGDGSWGVYSTNNSSSGYQGGAAYLNADSVGMSIGYGAYVAASGASSKNWALFAGAGNVKVTNNMEVTGNVAIGYDGSATEMLVVGKDLGNLTSYTGMVFGSNDYAHFFIGESSTSYAAQTYRANLDSYYTWHKDGSNAYYKTWSKGNYLKIGSTATNSTDAHGSQPIDDSDMPGLQLSTSGFSFVNGGVDYEHASQNFMFLYAKSDKLYLRRGNGTPVVIGST